MDYYSIPLMFQINIPPSKVYSSPACIYWGPDRVYTVQCVYSVIGETKLFPNGRFPQVPGWRVWAVHGVMGTLQCCRLQTADWCTANTIFTAATSPLQRCMWCTFLMSLCLRCQRNFSIFPKCIILFKDYALLNDLIFIVITSPCTCLKALSQPIIVEHILKSSSLNHVNFSDTHLLCG